MLVYIFLLTKMRPYLNLFLIVMHERAVLNFRHAVEMYETAELNYRHAVEMHETAVLNFRHAMEKDNLVPFFGFILFRSILTKAVCFLIACVY